MNPGETFLWSGHGTYVKFISVRSVGDDGIDSWYVEQRDVFADYHSAVRDFLKHHSRRTKKSFQKAYSSALSESEASDALADPVLEIHSVAIWVDSNDTGTMAESYFDDLQFMSIDLE